jgi:hypothetical protein
MLDNLLGQSLLLRLSHHSITSTRGLGSVSLGCSLSLSLISLIVSLTQSIILSHN